MVRRGLGRIPATFARLRGEGHKGLITYLAAGDPSLSQTVRRVLRLAEVGVDLVELGVPFSDPLADGRVNQAASERALAAGTTVDGILEAVREIRRHSEVPIVLYSYLNPLLARGWERTLVDMAEAGVDGLLPLDLPPEENPAYQRGFDVSGLDRIALVAPTSHDRRLRRILEGACGFVYCISRMGVTGARDWLDEEAREVVERTRRHTSLPLALGFGISTPEHVRQAVWADAVVVGSALVQRWHEAGRADDPGVLEWVRQMVEAAHGN